MTESTVSDRLLALVPEEPLDAFLKRELGVEGEPEIEPFLGGASNLTYRVTYPDRKLIVRRPPPGDRAAGAHDMRREASILAALRPHFPKVPALYACCTDPSIIGDEFLVMEELEGIILRKDPPEGLEISAGMANDLCADLVQTWSELHAVPAHSLEWLDKGAGYIERQVAGWDRRYAAAMTEDVPDFGNVRTWLLANQPKDRARVLIHNDFRFDNLVLDPSADLRIKGVLDWELATLGDPLMDVGASLAYWVEAEDHPAMHALRRQPTHLPGMWTRAELLERYGAQRGLEISDFLFYEIYGLFRLAGIAQQIYKRFHTGQFSDERFAELGSAVQALEMECRRRLDGKV